MHCRALPIVLLFGCCSTGCVVQRMHDDLAATRAGVEHLAMLAPTLERTNSALNQSNTQLAAMYKELTATRAALESIPPRLDESNRSLKESAASLHHLEPMMASLRNLDESLAVLRKTIENINKSIPLLDITKGTPPADEALQRARDTEPKAPAATPP